ncbi:hypothetical protein TNCV_2176431, partial [Trichonephila clavipes]
DVPIAIHKLIGFEHDGAPTYFSTDMCTYLNDTFGVQWIGNDGRVPWPPRSPDISSLDYFYGLSDKSCLGDSS